MGKSDVVDHRNAVAVARTRRVADTAPMQTDSYFKTKVENFTARELCGALVFFVISIFSCFIIGSNSPQVFDSTGVSKAMNCNNFMCSPTFRGYLAELTPLHQVFYLEVRMKRPFEYGHETEDEFELDFDLTLVISAQGESFIGQPTHERLPLVVNKKVVRRVHCRSGFLFCDRITLFAEDFLEFQGYHVQVTFEHPYVSSGLCTEEGFDVAAEIRKEIESHRDAITGKAPGNDGDVSHGYDRWKKADNAEVQEEEEEEDAVFGENGPSAQAEALHEALGKAAARDKLRFLPHSVDGHFEMKYVTKSFTKFEIGAKSVSVFGAVFAACLFYSGLNRLVTRKYWSYEQRWIVFLASALVFFDDPLFLIELYLPHTVFIAFNVISQMTFLAALLFFFLSVFDIIRSEAYWAERTTPRETNFYAPKAALCSALWFFGSVVFLYARLQTSADPTYFVLEDYRHHSIVKLVLQGLALMVGGRIAWLTIGCVRMAMLHHHKPRSHFLFIFTITVLMLVATMSGIVSGSLAPMISAKGDFVTFLGACNVYVCFLCYAYFPEDDTSEREIDWDRRHAQDYDLGVRPSPRRDLEMAKGVRRSLPKSRENPALDASPFVSGVVADLSLARETGSGQRVVEDSIGTTGGSTNTSPVAKSKKPNTDAVPADMQG
jgi:hypothetical protein